MPVAGETAGRGPLGHLLLLAMEVPRSGSAAGPGCLRTRSLWQCLVSLGIRACVEPTRALQGGSQHRPRAMPLKCNLSPLRTSLKPDQQHRGPGPSLGCHHSLGVTDLLATKLGSSTFWRGQCEWKSKSQPASQVHEQVAPPPGVGSILLPSLLTSPWPQAHTPATRQGDGGTLSLQRTLPSVLPPLGRQPAAPRGPGAQQSCEPVLRVKSRSGGKATGGAGRHGGSMEPAQVTLLGHLHARLDSLVCSALTVCPPCAWHCDGLWGSGGGRGRASCGPQGKDLGESDLPVGK